MTDATAVYPLGYPVEVGGAQQAIESAFESWGAWERIFDSPPLRVNVQTSEGSLAARPDFVAGEDQFALDAGPDNRAEFCLTERRVEMRISRATLADRERFRYHFLEAAVLTALDTLFLTPVHAACIARNGRGILLCGDSGAGKSTLAYAAARRGWTFVSEDASHAVNDDPTRVIGNPFRLSLRPNVSSADVTSANCRTANWP